MKSERKLTPSRCDFTVPLATTILSLLCLSPLTAQEPPAPITGIVFHPDTLNRFANGTDIWPVTWHDDGNLYLSGGDGDGCNGADTRGLDINRLSGGPQDNLGSGCVEVARFPDFLPHGLVSVDGILYLLRQERQDASGDGKPWSAFQLCDSMDDGASWHCTDWIHEGEEFLQGGMFINFGQSNSGARDGYVYIVAPYRTGGPLFDHIGLARAPKASIKNPDTYEYFAGEENGNVIWAADRNDRRPIRTDGDQIHWGPTIAYNPVLNRYLLCYFSDTSANLRCFDGSQPWGPWTLIHDGQFIDGVEKYSLFFVNKRGDSGNWISSDGTEWWLITSGKSGWDSLNVLKATLIMDGSLPNPPYDVTAD